MFETNMMKVAHQTRWEITYLLITYKIVSTFFTIELFPIKTRILNGIIEAKIRTLRSYNAKTVSYGVALKIGICRKCENCCLLNS